MEDNQGNIFGTLIEQLDDLLSKLRHISNIELWAQNPITNDIFRMLSNMKNVISSLVKKTINSKCQWEDLARTDYGSNKLIEKPLFENHIKSEEYIVESIKIQNAKPEIAVLQDSILRLEELLGDILDSSCQISNYPMKLYSGISVRDLVKVSHQYESIWQFLHSLVTLKTVIWPENEVEPCSQEINIKLLRSIQLCFKEMVKIKLHIEHFFKVNTIELQFTDLGNASSGLPNNFIPKTNACYLTDSQPYEQNENILKRAPQENIYKGITGSNNSSYTENCFLCSTPFFDLSDPQQSDNSYLFSSVPPWCNFKGLHSGYFNQNCTVGYSKDVELFDHAKFIHSHMGACEQEDYEHSKQSTADVLSMEQRLSKRECRSCSSYEYVNETSKHKTMEKGQKPDRNEEINDNDNLFDYNEISQEIHIPRNTENLSSDLRKAIAHNTDLFDATPLVIERSDHSCTKSLQKKDKFNVRHNGLEIEEPEFYNELQLKKDTKNLPQTQYFNRLGTLYPFKMATTEDKNVIFDPESLIEVFRAKNLTRSNSGSTEDESSSFCLWPVAANYIYVSSSKKSNHLKPADSKVLGSVSEDTLENKLQPIYLNQKYHQEKYEHLTGTDNIVEKSNTSSYSFFNDSLALFDSEIQDLGTNRTTKSMVNGTFNAFSTIKNTNVKCYNGGIKNNFVQKTMAVQFADCTDSFIVKNKRYTKENIEILNGNSYTNNLNSFISIFTSNVGTDRKVNHNKLFRRTINSLGRRKIIRDNLFNNIQTLTSNSGPYRLFDINGYPLTDSSGNVLKDPYGKSLVDFDLTGFPKSDTKVFDAAGNTPKDVNFDPTQKPKTSTIVLKLTDNLKRPLHLFDKYGRPLTDSYGKLLVNIHGRPLLRFDNFGQPSTDYRGGPLYTENGLRWSPTNSQSKEELMNGAKNFKQIQNNPGNGFFNSFDNEIPERENLTSKKETYSKEDLKINNAVNLNTSSSDIWTQVEIVLKNLPRKKKVQPTSSKTSVIVNNVSVLCNPLVKDFMKSIIYLDNLVEEESYNKDNVKLNNEICTHCIKELQTETIRDNKTNRTNSGMLENNNNNIMEKIEFSLRGSEFVREQSNYFLLKNDYNTNITGAKINLAYQDNSKNIQHDRNKCCLYNMRNGMFGDYDNHSKNIVSPLDSMKTNKTSDSTDFSMSQLTNIDLSKFSRDGLTKSNSPMTIESFGRISNQLQKLQDFDNYLTDKHKPDFQKTDPIKKQIKRMDSVGKCNNYMRKYEGYEPHIKNMSKPNLGQNNREWLKIPYKKTWLPSELLGKSDRLYELKIAEMVLKSLEHDASMRKEEKKTLPFQTVVCQNKSLVQINSNVTQGIKDIHLSEKINLNKVSNENNQIGKNEIPEKIQKAYNSLFRFNSNEGYDVKDNIDVKYMREGSGKTTSNVSVVTSETNYNQSQNEHQRLPENKVQNVKRLQSKHMTKNENDHGCYLKTVNPKKVGNEKIHQFKSQAPGKKYVNNKPEKLGPTNKECNLVAFLGSPVKYVLNKLDLTKSSRQKPNKLYKLPRKTNNPHPLDAPNQADNGQYKKRNNDIVINKKEIPDKIRQISNEKGKILAFRSKSCIEMYNQNTHRTMSYSGNEEYYQKYTDSTNTIPIQTQLRRYSSAICYLFEKCEDDKKSDHRNKLIINKPKYNEPYSLKINNSTTQNLNKEGNHKVVKLRKAIPVRATKKYAGSHSRRHKKAMF